MYSLKTHEKVQFQQLLVKKYNKKSKCQHAYDPHSKDLVTTGAALATLQKFKVHQLKGCGSVDVQITPGGGGAQDAF